MTLKKKKKSKHKSYIKKVNQVRKTKVNQVEKARNRNTTPLLTVKTLTSLGATRKMTIDGGATSDARIELSEDGGNVSNGGNQWRRDQSGNAFHNRSCIRDCDDDRSVVVERVGDSNSGSWLIGSNGGGCCSRGGWCLNLLSSSIGDHSSGRGDL